LSQVSVIVPVYNAAETLRACAESLLAQEFDGELDIVFVDNNSTDAGIGRIPADARIRVLSESTQSAYAARNTGVAAARGDILLFTDPDCVAEAGWIAAHLRTLRKRGTAISLGRVRHGGNGNALRLLGEYDHARQLSVFHSRAGSHYFGYTNNLGITAAAWKALGPFEIRQRGADTLLVQKALGHFGPAAIRYAPCATLRHLEVDTVATYFHKMFLYGRSSRLFRSVAAPAPPGWALRRRAVGLALGHLRAGVVDRVVLTGSLILGVAAWQLGYRVGLGALRDDARAARIREAD